MKRLRPGRLAGKRQALLISLVIIFASVLISVAVVSSDVVKTNTNHNGVTHESKIENGTNRFAFGVEQNSTEEKLIIFTVDGFNGSLLVRDESNYRKALRNGPFNYDESFSRRNISNGHVEIVLPAGHYYFDAYVGDSVPVTLTVKIIDPEYKVSYPLIRVGAVIASGGTFFGVMYYMARKNDG